MASRRPQPVGEIYGHMPQPRPRLLAGPRWLIDMDDNSRLAALVRGRRARGWSPVVVRMSQLGVTLTQSAA